MISCGVREVIRYLVQHKMVCFRTQEYFPLLSASADVVRRCVFNLTFQ